MIHSPLIAALFAGAALIFPACAETVNTTFLLSRDIYNVGDASVSAMPGIRRKLILEIAHNPHGSKLAVK